jgi:hypothetical protein
MATKTVDFLLTRLSILSDILLGNSQPVRLDPPAEFFLFRPGVRTPGGRTANYVSMGWVGAYLFYSLDSPESAEAKYWRRQAEELYRQQLVQGHMTVGRKCEQTAPSPHGGMHIAAALAARIGAIHFKHERVKRLAGLWIKNNVDIGKACSTADGTILCTGMRAKAEEIVFDVWSKVNAVVTGNPFALPKAKQLATNYWLALRLALELKKAGDDFGGALDDNSLPESLPFTAFPMSVTRNEGGFLVVMEDRKDFPRQEPVDWVLASADGSHTLGRKWQTPPPELEGRVIRSIVEPERFREPLES